MRCSYWFAEWDLSDCPGISLLDWISARRKKLLDKYKEEEHSQSRLQNDIFFLPVLNKGRSVNYLQRQKTILRISTHTWRSLSQAISLRQGRKDHQISKLQSFLQLVDIEFDHHSSNFCLTHWLGMNYTKTQKRFSRITIRGKISSKLSLDVLVFPGEI